jgi:hypothetical protein
MVAGTLTLGLAMWIVPGVAQGPLNDEIKVNLPYTVTIGDKTLQPGEYYIREMPSDAKSYVLLIYGDNGMKFETSVLTIPTLDLQTPDDSKVVLHHFGNDYYFDKIWIQGKNYGYEFPLPDSVKQREQERMQSETVTATYHVPPPPAAAPAPVETAPPAQTVEAAPPPPAPEPEPQPMAQNTPPEPAPEPAVTEENNSANREMPATSAGWLMMLLSGGTLSGAGMLLRRKR